MPSQLRSKGIDPQVAAAVSHGVAIGAGLYENKMRQEAAAQQAADAQAASLLREKEETRRALLLKGLELNEKSLATAAKNTWDFNKDYFNDTTKVFLDNLTKGHPYQPAEWLKPDNAWKLTPESRSKAEAYLYQVSLAEERVARSKPRDFSVFSDPATMVLSDGKPLLERPTNYSWQPEYSEAYKADLAKKGIIAKSDSEKDSDAAKKDRLQAMTKSRVNTIGQLAEYASVADQTYGLWKKYGGDKDWATKAAAEGMTVDEAGNPITVVRSLINKQATLRPKASGAMAELMTYMKDPNYVSAFIEDQYRGTPTAANAENIGKAIADFVSVNAPKFNNFTTADDGLGFRNWLSSSAKGMDYSDPMTSRTVPALGFNDPQTKAIASKTFELLFNQDLFAK